MIEIPKRIDYKNRLKDAFEAIIIIVEKRQGKNPTPALKNIKRIAEAQLGNLEGVENKDSA